MPLAVTHQDRWRKNRRAERSGRFARTQGEGEGRGRKWGVAVWKDRGTMKSEQSHYSRAEPWRERGSYQKHLPRAISEQKEAKAVRLSTPECSRAAISLHHYHNKLITEIRGGRGARRTGRLCDPTHRGRSWEHNTTFSHTSNYRRI